MSTYRSIRRLAANAVSESFAAVEESRSGLPSRRVVTLKRLVAMSGSAATLCDRLPELETRLNQSAFEGLVPVAEVGGCGGSAWIVEENVEGETLRTLLASLAVKKGRLAPNEGFAVLLQVATVLAELHAPSVPMVHGDLCPSTIVVTPAGDVRLSETGVAKLCAEATGAPVRAEAQSVSPEQLALSYEPAGDLFRIGLVMHELALGRPLFPTGDLAQANALARSYGGLSPSAFPSVPEPFASMLLRFLALDPAQRPSAEDAKFALQQGIARMGWHVGSSVVAALYAKAFPGREPLSNLWAAPGDEVALLSLDAVGPMPSGDSELHVSGAGEEDRFPFLYPSPAGGQPRPPPFQGSSSIMGSPLAGGPSGPALSIQIGEHGASLPPAPLPRPPTLVPTVAPVAPLPEQTAPAGRLSPVPEEEPLEELSEVDEAPARTEKPAAPAAPSGATLARIGVKKVSAAELKALKAAEAPPPPPVQRGGRKSVPTVAVKDQRIGEHLLSSGKLTKERFDEAVSYANDFEASMPDALVAIAAVEEDDVITAWAEVTRSPTISGKRLDEMPPVPEALRLLPSGAAEALCAVPLSLKGSTQLVVAVRDPLDENVLAELKVLTKVSSVVTIRAGEQAIRRTIVRYYGTAVSATLPSWLEMGGGGGSAGGAAGGKPPRRQTSLPPELLGAPRSSDGPEVAPRLVELLLAQQGDKGRDGAALLELLAKACQRIGLDAGDQTLVWAAAAAVVTANLAASRRPSDVSRLDDVAQRIGEAWAPLAQVAGPAAEARRGAISWMPAAVFAAGLSVAAATNLARPSLTEAMPGLDAVRSRVPGVVVDTLLALLKQG